MNNSTTLVASTIKGMHHVGIAVSDVEKSVEFYQSVTALKRINHDNIAGYLPEPCEKSAVLKGPNGYLQLMQFAGPSDLSEVPVAGPGVTHLCLQSPAEDALFNKFINNGARPVSKGDQPIDLNGQGVRYGYARDADNIMFEIEQLDQPRFEGSIWIAHIALVTPDLDQSVAFYR
ncbi:MAG: VOC family protein, partial [Gammaproteobacteria bacterium]|nr:VOC family protein [Gammaproteobacteria bacterium]